MAFTYTEAIDKLRRLTKPIRVIQGGTWAGKTEGIIANYIDALTQTSDMKLLVTAESIPALKGGAIDIFMNTMQSVGNWNDDNYNYTDRIYKFPSGGKVQFSSYDTVGKAQAAGKWTDLFINEAQYVPYLIVDALMIRTSGTVTFDFNPNNPFYIHEEIMGGVDVDHLILTYEDNETTPDKIKRDFEKKKAKAFYDPEGDWNDPNNIKSHFHANWCRVYIRGELGSLEGVIFQNWSIIPELPTIGHYGYGLDFGYVKPASWVAGYLIDGKRIFDEIIYQSKLSNKALASMMKANGNTMEWTYADEAEPKSIDELYHDGIKIQGARKGPDSVSFGLDVLQSEDFYVTARSTNLISELRQYSWEINRQGINTGKPVKENDHAIDAMRYLAMEKLSKSNQPRSGSMISVATYT